MLHDEQSHGLTRARMEVALLVQYIFRMARLLNSKSLECHSCFAKRSCFVYLGHGFAHRIALLGFSKVDFWVGLEAP